MLETTRYEVTATGDAANLTMHISMLKNGSRTSSLEVPTSKASTIVGIVLGTAVTTYDKSGKPPAYVRRMMRSISPLFRVQDGTLAPGKQSSQ